MKKRDIEYDHMRLVDQVLGVTAQDEGVRKLDDADAGTDQDRLNEYIGVLAKAQSLSESEPPDRMRLAVQLAFEKRMNRRAFITKLTRIGGVAAVPTAAAVFFVIWMQGMSTDAIGDVQERLTGAGTITWQETLVRREQGQQANVSVQDMVASHSERYMIVFQSDTWPYVPIRLRTDTHFYSREIDSLDGTMIQYHGEMAKIQAERFTSTLDKLILPEELLTVSSRPAREETTSNAQSMTFKQLGERGTGSAEIVVDKETGLLNSIVYLAIELEEPLVQSVTTRNSFEYDAKGDWSDIDAYISQLPISYRNHWFAEPDLRMAEQEEIDTLGLRVINGVDTGSLGTLVNSLLPGELRADAGARDTGLNNARVNVSGGLASNVLDLQQMGLGGNQIGQIVIPADYGQIYTLNGVTTAHQPVIAIVWKRGTETTCLAILPAGA